MATIQDVAKAAGVSVATVSRVLNNSGLVQEETRETVMEAIRALNYQPNLLGRNLRRMETRMILVLLPNISNPFYSRIVKGIEDVAHKNGYNIMLCNTDSDKMRERIYLELLKKRLSDGIILMASELSREELLELGKNYPVVQCCEYREDVEITHVSIDNYSAAKKAVNHLIGQGHKRIAMISCKNNFLSTVQREAGYKKVLEESGIEFDPDLLAYGDYGYKSGLRTAKQFLSMQDKPTAIFAISDMMAIGAIKAVRQAGLKIPEDIAVVGFDNINFASMCEPELTTVSQPKYDIGCYTMEFLIRQIKGESKSSQAIFLEHELIIRASTVK
ncbi:MAG: LacI family DNA-binding transcriptional regulator [Clostridia bacterium]|nr:LacI family DNA-binding transcriptional regulator [Clostridia bacterium]